MIGRILFLMLISAASLNAGKGACYIKIYKMIKLSIDHKQLVEGMMCEPLTQKRCHEKIKKISDYNEDGIISCHLHSWVEGQPCAPTL